MADGKLIFETKIDDSGFARSQQKMQDAVKDTDAAVKNLDSDLQSAGSRRMQSADLETLQKRLTDATTLLDKYQARLEALQRTAQSGNLMPDIDGADTESTAKMESLSRRIKNKQAQIEKLQKRIDKLCGKTVTVDADTTPAEQKIKQIDGKLTAEISPITIDTDVTNATTYGNLGSVLDVLGTKFSEVALAAASAFSAKALVDFGKQAVTLASDLQEVQNVVDTAFGEMSYKMEQFADTAIEMYGISKLAAKQTGSTLMAMASGMGIAADDASDMAIALTGLSADMASFYNVEQEIASTALKSVFTGETETLKQFGIVMTEANLQAFAMQQGITKSISAMTQAEKVQLRYNYVMAQTTLAQGDFAKTSNQWANQLRILSEQWNQFASIVGNGLIQVLSPVLQAINLGLTKLISYADLAYHALAELFGWETQAASGVASSISMAVDEQNALTDAVQATTAAQDAQLASFDKITKISTNATTASSATGGSMAVTDTVSSDGAATSTSDDTAQKLAEFDFTNLSTSLEKLKTNALPVINRVGEAFSWLYEKVLKPCGSWVLSDALPAGLDVLSGALRLLESAIALLEPYATVLWDHILGPCTEGSRTLVVTGLEETARLLNEIADWIDHINETGELEPFLAYWVEENETAIEDFFNTTTFGKKWNTLWQDIGGAVFDTVHTVKTDMKTLGGHLQDFGEGWFDTFEGVGEDVADFVADISDALDDFGDDVSKSFQTVWGGIKSGAKAGINGAIDLLNSMVGAFEDAANALLDGLNRIHFDIPEWVPVVGGESFGIHIPKIDIPDIPRLASGTVVPANFGEFLAVLGDNKHEAEVVSPVSAIEQAMRNVLNRVPLASGGDINLVVQLDGMEIYKAVVRRAQQSKRMTGSNPLAE